MAATFFYPHLHNLPPHAFGPYRAIVADLIWFCYTLRDEEHSAQSWYETVEYCMQLDPHANGLLRHGATSLLVYYQRPDLAEQLLAHYSDNPIHADDWRILVLRATIAQNYYGDQQQAAAYLKKAVSTTPKNSVLLADPPAVPDYCVQWYQRIKQEMNGI